MIYTSILMLLMIGCAPAHNPTKKWKHFPEVDLPPEVHSDVMDQLHELSDHDVQDHGSGSGTSLTDPDSPEQPGSGSRLHQDLVGPTTPAPTDDRGFLDRLKADGYVCKPKPDHPEADCDFSTKTECLEHDMSCVWMQPAWFEKGGWLLVTWSTLAGISVVGGVGICVWYYYGRCFYSYFCCPGKCRTCGGRYKEGENPVSCLNCTCCSKEQATEHTGAEDTEHMAEQAADEAGDDREGMFTEVVDHQLPAGTGTLANPTDGTRGDQDLEAGAQPSRARARTYSTSGTTSTRYLRSAEESGTPSSTLPTLILQEGKFDVSV